MNQRQTKQYSQAELEKLRVVDLKEILRDRKLKVSGKKDELVLRILKDQAISHPSISESMASLPPISLQTILSPITSPVSSSVLTPITSPTITLPLLQTSSYHLSGNYRKEELENMRVVDLKKILRDRNLKVSGRKAELVSRILKSQETPPILIPTTKLPLQELPSALSLETKLPTLKKVRFADMPTIHLIPSPRETKPVYQPHVLCPRCGEIHLASFPCKIRRTVFDNQKEFQKYCDLRKQRPQGPYARSERSIHLQNL